MEYKRFKDTVIVRMDVNEEITEQVKAVALAENIKLAEINALGAIKELTVGVFNVGEQKYYQSIFSGFFEITSLHGSISTMNGEFYSHLHITAADSAEHVVGGHLNRAVVGATCEMFIRVIDGSVERVKDPAVGINIFKF